MMLETISTKSVKIKGCWAPLITPHQEPEAPGEELLERISWLRSVPAARADRLAIEVLHRQDRAIAWAQVLAQPVKPLDLQRIALDAWLAGTKERVAARCRDMLGMD